MPMPRGAGLIISPRKSWHGLPAHVPSARCRCHIFFPRQTFRVERAPRSGLISNSRHMKCILVPIDCSDATPGVVDLAREIAKAFGAEVHLLHVKELSVAPVPGGIGYGLASMPELTPISG